MTKMLRLETLPIMEHWDCHQCGHCCRGSIISLSSEDAERLRSQGWDQHPDFAGERIVTPLAGRHDALQLAKRADGSCVFLTADNQCRIHQLHGANAKPLVCRMFPLQIIPQEKHAVLTLRRACPSAAADRGRPLSEHVDEARQLAAEGGLLKAGVAAPSIKQGESSDWKRARLVLDALKRLTGDERYPPIRRLVHGVELCRLLDTAQTPTLDNRQLAELLQVLEEHIAEEAAEHFSERQPPTTSAQILFRQTALEVLRLHPRLPQTASWGTRLKLPLWAWRMVRGKGELPKLHPSLPVVTFAQLEEPLAKLSPAIIGAIARYFETTSASTQYALADRVGWSIVDSYRQLALLYPLLFWLLRWQTAGRLVEENDVYEMICALDRAQGFAALSGAKQRNRVRTLTRLEQLPAIIAWYGR